MSAAASPSTAAAHELPLAARRLGHAGLLPFVFGAALVWLVRDDAHPYATLAMSAYAAVVVSFLGGIHWGLAFRHDEPPLALLAWGVLPSLVAWVAVMMPPSAGLVVHGTMLAACYAVDRRIYAAEGVARWLTLRFRLSAVAALSCFVAAAGT
ncbi:MAG: DUF3429 domain-containing protein [Leptothrix sp. (in: Bacteria)]|nr:DUF3429 domain-containing protein [Leptothrix sp. (in: b-proteobacteria)]